MEDTVPAGYVVLMVHMTNGTIGSFKIGWGVKNVHPSDKEMANMIFADPATGANLDLFFKGWQLPDDAEKHSACWVAIPSTAYTTASWEYYTADSLADIIKENQKFDKRTEDALQEFAPYSGLPGQGQGYH